MKLTGIDISYVPLREKQGEGEVTLGQSDYILESLCEMGLQDCNPASAPCEAQVGMPIAEQDITAEERLKAQKAAGILVWVMSRTRPDLAFAVFRITSLVHHCPRASWLAAKRAFRFLKKTHDYVIRYRASKPEDFEVIPNDHSVLSAFERRGETVENITEGRLKEEM